jgi:hypothetical protein
MTIHVWAFHDNFFAVVLGNLPFFPSERIGMADQLKALRYDELTFILMIPTQDLIDVRLDKYPDLLSVSIHGQKIRAYGLKLKDKCRRTFTVISLGKIIKSARLFFSKFSFFLAIC